MKKSYFFLMCVLLGVSVYGQQYEWKLDPAGSVMQIEQQYEESLPPKIDLVIYHYNGTASVKYADGVCTVGNIKWGGNFNMAGYGASVSTSLEDAIFRANGKIRPVWENRLRAEITNAILKELSFYKL